MDYGKLAYLRLDEIESMISSTESLPVKNTSLSVKPNHALRNSNQYSVTAMSGTGSVGFFLTIEFNTNVAGTVGVFIDGVRVGVFTLTSGIGQYNVNTSVRFDENAVLTIEADESYQGLITQLDVVLVGQDAYIMRASTSFCAGSDGANVYVMYHDGENAKLDCLDSSGNFVSTIATLSTTIFDIDVDSSGMVYVSYVDAVGNTWVSKYSSGGITASARVCDNVDCVAVYCSDDSTVIAFVKDKALSYVEVLADLTVSNSSNIDIKVDATDISFCKNATTPTLFITSGDRIFVLFANGGISASSSLEYVITAGVEEI